MNKRERLEGELSALERRKNEILEELSNMCLLEDLAAGTFFKEVRGKGVVFQKMEPTQNLARMMLPEMPVSCGISLIRYLVSNRIGYRSDNTEVIVVPAPDEEAKEKLLLRSIIHSLGEIESGLQGPLNAGNSVAYNKVHRLRSAIEKSMT